MTWKIFSNASDSVGVLETGMLALQGVERSPQWHVSKIMICGMTDVAPRDQTRWVSHNTSQYSRHISNISSVTGLNGDWTIGLWTIAGVFIVGPS